jgi:hypothetical protein
LALLRAVDPAEAEAFWVLVVQDFDGVAVEDAYHRTGDITRPAVGREKQNKKGWKSQLFSHRPTVIVHSPVPLT